ncbi:unnamed protein product [Peniophora sp. CBMAI 1063]|nr:unnamed protein product [Peniophora sp. CBMAI 1063]
MSATVPYQMVHSPATVDAEDLTKLLPPELLTDIFAALITLLAEEHDSRGVDITSPLQPLDWISITHVCRRWHAVALESPTLWTQLVPSTKQPWDIFLERSKNAPLSVECSFKHLSTETKSARIASVLTHQHRLRELRIGGLSLDDFDLLKTGLTQRLIQLTVLSIHCAAPVGKPLPILPLDFISKALPRLRELRLVGVDFPRDTGSTSLTKFDYQSASRSHSADNSSIASVAGILGTLGQMPALRALRLRMSHPIRNPQDAPVRQPATLYHLEELVLETRRDDTCWYIWSGLHLPSVAHVNIQSGGGPNTEETEGLMLGMLFTHISMIPAETFASLRDASVHLEQGRRLTVQLRAPPERDDEGSDCGEYDWPALKVFSSAPSLQSTAFRLHITSSPDVALDVTLSVGVECAWALVLIRKLLLRAQEVTHLKLGGALPGTICYLLEPGQPYDGGMAQSRAMPLPALAELRCVGVDFNAVAPVEYDGAIIPAHEVLSRVLAIPWEGYLDAWNRYDIQITVQD